MRNKRNHLIRLAGCGTASRTPAGRRGAVLVEAAISIPIFLTVVLGLIELSLVVMINHRVAEATRHLSRVAAVHGSLANRLGEWGPGTMTGSGSDSSAPAVALRNRLPGLDPARVTYTIEWIDGDNDIRNDDRIRVTAGMTYRPMFTSLFGSAARTIESVSTIPVAH